MDEILATVRHDITAVETNLEDSEPESHQAAAFCYWLFFIVFQHFPTIRGMICWDDSEMMSCFDEWRSPAFFWQLQVKTEQHHGKKHEENMTHPNISTSFELYTGKRKFVFSRKVKGWNFASFWNRYEQVERVNTSLSIVTYRNTGAKLLYRFWLCWISSAKLIY